MAVAAPASGVDLKVYTAPLEAQQLKEFTSRPRIDFTSIFSTVRCRGSDGCGNRLRHRCRRRSGRTCALALRSGHA